LTDTIESDGFYFLELLGLPGIAGGSDGTRALFLGGFDVSAELAAETILVGTGLVGAGPTAGFGWEAANGDGLGSTAGLSVAFRAATTLGLAAALGLEGILGSIFALGSTFVLAATTGLAIGAAFGFAAAFGFVETLGLVATMVLAGDLWAFVGAFTAPEVLACNAR